MGIIETIAVLITLAAVFSYINHRWIKLPTVIGVMLIGLVVSLVLIAISSLIPQARQWAQELLDSVDFNQALMHGMLGILLFAGALHVDINDLGKQKLVIGLLATLGILISTAVVGALTWWALWLVGLEIGLVYCLLFGSLISPTDPIAVLSILKTLGAPRELQTNICGESLFNDGVGIVVYLVIAGIAGFGHTGAGAQEMTASHVGVLFLQEAGGGAVFGMILGWIAYRMLKSVDNYQVEILLTLALVLGGYSLANRLHMSGAIAMVVSGLMIGNHGRSFAMSDRTRVRLDEFWELVDEVLNAVLFVLLGLEVIVVTFTGQYLLAGLLAIPVVLLARFVSVGIPVVFLRRVFKKRLVAHVVKVLTWSGLRGGISVALALAIPTHLHGQLVVEREVILAMTYLVVVFSILVQGLSVGVVIRRCKIDQTVGLATVQ